MMRKYLVYVKKWIDVLNIWHIIFLAFFLRMLFAIYIFIETGSNEKVFLNQWEPRWSDCYEYQNVARNIFHYGEISTGTSERVPYIDKPLGYPVFLLISVYFDSLWPVVILQVFLSSFSVYFLFLIGQLVLKSNRIAKIVALIFTPIFFLLKPFIHFYCF